ncbi:MULTISPECIES: DNA replication/repair protein RecF [unclassified Streptococcus]|uniref:DNA replication/repair protein RecF n=1 Tax=unclassified Streptococcus TaxID=2608887 RepID=UPI0010723DAF|nr:MULTISPECIES: DNA replication/repair protein RecF [unclassified Streptococcus]MBF0806582.1 DNA replication/repair protein RecF [Streptococcus sp. 19428wA2_WM07]TFU27339.1 DNA replication/repair protein RecF [Streptococcus sp. WM07]
MWLKELEIHQFRNYKDVNLQFQPGLNVFLGQNAQGKTNLLEAIYFLALTRSHRTRFDKELTQFNSDNFRLQGVLSKLTGTLPLEVSWTSKGRMTKVNHLRQAKLSNYVGHMNVVLFAPEDLQLIKGSPNLRRKFIDIDLGQIKPTYLAELSHYQHILKQRNSYLKSAQSIDPHYLDVLDEQLAQYGARVIQHRLQFLNDLETVAKKQQEYLSQENEHLTIQYESSIDLQLDLQFLVKELAETLLQKRQTDILKRTTSIGPHRDDVQFAINGMDAKFGSQGQQRSLILSLKLAEIQLIKEVTRESPILLLDDVMSELDNQRQTKLLEAISGDIQTFLTTTSLDHLQTLPIDLQIFNIHQGEILPETL